MPDHLAMELEFLSFLYQRATDKEIKRFMGDHLDWITFLREKFKEFHSHPFYWSALEVLLVFLRKEKERLEVECHG
jgi:TorA maturation chaperone TorD